jgi:hypothetical protein
MLVETSMLLAIPLHNSSFSPPKVMTGLGDEGVTLLSDDVVVSDSCADDVCDEERF